MSDEKKPRYEVQQHGWGWIVYDTENEDGLHPACTCRKEAEQLCKEMNMEERDEKKEADDPRK